MGRKEAEDASSLIKELDIARHQDKFSTKRHSRQADSVVSSRYSDWPDFFLNSDQRHFYPSRRFQQQVAGPYHLTLEPEQT